MFIILTTVLDTDADRAWRLIQKSSTFLFVARGLLGVSGSKYWPENWCEGETIKTRLWLFHFIPTWRHQLHIISVNEMRREIKTAEHGGLMRTWKHTLSVEPISGDRCRYRDGLEFEAGILTWFMWPAIQVFFRYRQMRLRKLAKAQP